MKVNNIKEVRDEIASKPENYNQTVVYNACGTPACIAGHAAHLATPPGGYQNINCWDFAKDFLGLTGEQATDLFSSFPYPRQHDAPATVDEALAVLDNLIETGKVRWPPRDQEDEK